MHRAHADDKEAVRLSEMLRQSSCIERREKRMEFRAQEGASGAAAVFRVVPGQLATSLASQLPRRERWVLLLIDGRRSVADLARLTQRGELDIASTLARFLQRGYIEPVNTIEHTTSQFVARYSSD